MGANGSELNRDERCDLINLGHLALKNYIFGFVASVHTAPPKYIVISYIFKLSIFSAVLLVKTSNAYVLEVTQKPLLAHIDSRPR